MEWHERNTGHDLIRELHLRTADFYEKTGHTPQVMYIGHETKRELFVHARCFVTGKDAEMKDRQDFAGMRVITVTEPYFLGFGV